MHCFVRIGICNVDAGQLPRSAKAFVVVLDGERVKVTCIKKQYGARLQLLPHPNQCIRSQSRRFDHVRRD